MSSTQPQFSSQHSTVANRIGNSIIVTLAQSRTVDRTTDGTGRVADKTLAELQALDAGCWKGPQFCGQTIPLFDDLLRLVKGKNIFIVMDQKADGLGRYIRAALDRVGLDMLP